MLKSYGSLHSKTPFYHRFQQGYFSEVRFLQVELRQKLIRIGGAGRKWKDFWKNDPNSLGLDIYCQFQWCTSRKSIPTREILTRPHP